MAVLPDEQVGYRIMLQVNRLLEDKMGHNVTVFANYPFQLGQKIRIEGPNRRGDWQVVGVGDREVTLRCPISGREFVWKNFCYFTHEEQDAVWPQP